MVTILCMHSSRIELYSPLIFTIHLYTYSTGINKRQKYILMKCSARSRRLCSEKQNLKCIKKKKGDYLAVQGIVRFKGSPFSVHAVIVVSKYSIVF